MTISFDDIIQDCVSRSGNTPGVDIAVVIPRVWSCFVRHVATALKGGRGVHVPRFAKLTFMKTSGRPIFDVAEVFLRANAITMKKPPTALQSVCMDVNFSRVAHDAQVEKDFARTVVDTLLHRLGEVIGDGKEAVRASFGTVGTIYGEGKTMVFRYAREKRGPAASGQSSAASFSAQAPASALGLSLTGGGMDGGFGGGGGGGGAGYGGGGGEQAQQQGGGQPESSSPPASYRSRAPTARSARISARSSALGGASGQRSTMSKAGLIAMTTSLSGATIPTKAALQSSHLGMMATQKASAQAQRDEDAMYYQQSLRDMRDAERVRQTEQSAKAAEVRAIAGTQTQQRAELVARSRADRELEIEQSRSAKYPLPFPSDEEVKQKRLAGDADYRKGLDAQLAEPLHNPAMSTTKRVPRAMAQPPQSQVQSVHNVFPRFLEPEREVSRAHFVPPELYQANMRQSWDAVHMSLHDEGRALQRDAVDVQRRRERAELIHQKAAIEKRREMAELNEFLKNQARFKQKLDHDYEHERFYGKDPDPSQCYPVEAVRNLEREETLKGKLRNALDVQVAAKGAKAGEERRCAKQEDNFFIDCVQQALRNDRAFRRKKIINDRLMLTSQWQAQQDLTAKQKAIEKQRSNIGIFVQPTGEASASRD
jgi:hypothetical protein